MLPQTSIIENEQESINYVFDEERIYYTFRLNQTKNIIDLKIDNKTSIHQSIYMIMMTEKGIYHIYPEWYGSSLFEYIGQDIIYVKANLEDVIKKDLMNSDNRILDVTEFIIKETIDEQTINVEFTVNTIFGNIRYKHYVNNGKVGE